MDDAAWDYIKSDLFRYTQSTSLGNFARQFRSNRAFRLCVWRRLYGTERNPFLRWILAHLYDRVSRKTGIQIPPATRVGKGLYLGHGMCVVVHPKTIIGDNCNLSQFTTIGSNHNTPARIGNNVYIGPGVCIVEDVTIGDNAIIGAGAVVIKDVPPNCTVAGNPAKVISQNRRDPDAPTLWKD